MLCWTTASGIRHGCNRSEPAIQERCSARPCACSNPNARSSKRCWPDSNASDFPATHSRSRSVRPPFFLAPPPRPVIRGCASPRDLQVVDSPSRGRIPRLNAHPRPPRWPRPPSPDKTKTDRGTAATHSTQDAHTARNLSQSHRWQSIPRSPILPLRRDNHASMQPTRSAATG